MEKYKVKINDVRLTPDMRRTRQGRTQLFRRDYRDNKFASEENADVVLIHPKQEVYAELIDNAWYWVKGCSKCEDSLNFGRKYSYQVCYEHDRCISCSTHREDLTDTPFGHQDGFLCKPCADKRDKDERAKAFSKMPPNEEYNEFDYRLNDTVICPHCGSDCGSDGFEHSSGIQEHECFVCKGNFEIELDYTITYSTKVIGERLLK